MRPIIAATIVPLLLVGCTSNDDDSSPTDVRAGCGSDAVPADDMAAALYEYNPNDGYVAVVTAYAESLRDEPELYTGYHAFQVFFATSAGTGRLPVGYSHTAPIDAATYLSAQPRDAASPPSDPAMSDTPTYGGFAHRSTGYSRPR